MRERAVYVFPRDGAPGVKPPIECDVSIHKLAGKGGELPGILIACDCSTPFVYTQVRMPSCGLDTGQYAPIVIYP